MSNEDKNSHNIPYYSSFNQDYIHTMSSQGFAAFPITTGHNYNHFDLHNHRHQQPPPPQNPSTDRRFDHSNSDPMSFSNFLQGEVLADYNTLSNAFDLSCSSSDQVAIYDNSDSNDQLIVVREAAASAAVENPRTPNSSVSLSSQEAGVEEESSKSKKDLLQQNVCEEGDHHGKSKNVTAKKKEDVKKQRQPRFAFMTKSEVDNLEDGYRWRKYGQKAVKNSPFPRSYYRCTSQKCGVKKRIERSFEEPSMVITTYEGQHNHHSPATVRGNAAAMLGFSPFPINIFPHQDHHQMFFPSSSTNYHQAENRTMINSTYQQQDEQLLHQLPDDGGLLMPANYGSFFPPQSEAINEDTHITKSS